jgi:hypothetical protein
MALRLENGYPSRQPGTSPPRFRQPLPFVFRRLRRGFPVVASALLRAVVSDRTVRMRLRACVRAGWI